MSPSQNEAFRDERSLRRLEIAITGKLNGLLHGNYESLLYGPGIERGEGRPYQPSDDARRVDWSLSARMNELHVRDTIAERELETWLVVDSSASLEFGTARMEKCDLALIATAAFGLMGTQAGNRTGLVRFDADGTEIVAPRGGRKSVMQILHRIQRRPRGAVGAADLSNALRVVDSTVKRRGRIVVISDLLDGGAWPSTLRRIAARHDVIVAEVSDPREWSLPASGLLTLVDPETGALLEVQTSDRRLRARFEEAATRRRAEVDGAVRRANARHLRLSTDRDWMADFVGFARSTKWAV